MRKTDRFPSFAVLVWDGKPFVEIHHQRFDLDYALKEGWMEELRPEEQETEQQNAFDRKEILNASFGIPKEQPYHIRSVDHQEGLYVNLDDLILWVDRIAQESGSPLLPFLVIEMEQWSTKRD